MTDSPETGTELAAFIEAVEWVHREHRVSFVQAGDEQIFAYGGDGYVVVLSGKVFFGLVELETPLGSARVEPNDSGDYRVSVTPEGVSAKSLLAAGTVGLRRYYEKRYWKI